MKILIITPRFPYPIEKGDKLRVYHQIRYLSKWYDIYLIALSDIRVEQAHLEHIRQFVREVHLFRLYPAQIVASNLFRIFKDVPLQVLYFFNHSIRKKIHRLHSQIEPDIIFNQLIRTTEYTRDLKGFKVLDYMDAFSAGMHKRTESCSPLIRWFYRMERDRLIRYEKAIYPFFDRHCIISSQDRDRIALREEDAIEIVPNGVDTDFFAPSVVPKKYDICFVGNMGYRPNVLAAEYLSRELLPGLLKIKPDIRILLAGARPDPRVKQLAGKHVVVSGWMEDIRRAYDESVIFVAPIFTGIGQQNKVLEAMSMHMPCVCTSTVNNAIGSRAGKEVLIADSRDMFIQQIQILLENNAMAMEIGQKSRKFVEENYGWEKQVKKLKGLFDAANEQGK